MEKANVFLTEQQLLILHFLILTKENSEMYLKDPVVAKFMSIIRDMKILIGGDRNKKLFPPKKEIEYSMYNYLHSITGVDVLEKKEINKYLEEFEIWEEELYSMKVKEELRVILNSSDMVVTSFKIKIKVRNFKN